jgi:hypothetical protein
VAIVSEPALLMLAGSWLATELPLDELELAAPELVELLDEDDEDDDPQAESSTTTSKATLPALMQRRSCLIRISLTPSPSWYFRTGLATPRKLDEWISSL